MSPKRTWLLSLLALGAVACGGEYPQSTFHPTSDFAHALNDLFFGVFWWAVVVFVVVEGLLLFAIFRFRARPGAPEPKHVHGNTILEIGWTIAPALILVFIAVPTIRQIFKSQGVAPADALRIEVVGHQWWWEFRYPELGITTANELHVPVGRPVALEMTTVDVIHSFWVPKLAGKRDVIANHVNRLSFTPDSLGMFLGQCAEFCGTSHANMRFQVFVDDSSTYASWVTREQGGPAPLDSGSLAAEGHRIFSRSACIGCHTMAGVPVAVAKVGPDLSHVASRRTLAAGLFPNDSATLRAWVHDAPQMKPGSLMPAMPLSDADLDAVVAYLRSRR